MADPFAKKPEDNAYGRYLQLVYQLNELDEDKNSLGRLSRSPVRQTAGSPRPTSRSPLPPERLNTRRNSRGEFLLPSSMTSLGTSAMGTGRSEVVLKQKIQALEDTVAEYERQKFNVMGTFAEYRERVAERERKLEAEYSAKIISLSDEVLAAKKDFEERMKQFQALQERFEREKEAALQKLRQEHQKEIQLLEQRCSESQLMNLEQKYVYEIQRLEEERKSLKAEKEHLGDAFQSKLRRAQTLYETELAASKALYSKELEALKDHEEALKEELMARQDEFKDRLEEIQHQFQYSKQELVRCKEEIAELEIRLKEKEAEVAAISAELQGARTVSEQALEKLASCESELAETRNKFQEMEEELQRKTNMLSMLETAKSQLEAVIQDLQVEVRSLKNKVAFLEEERQNLESQSETQSQLQNSQVQALEAVMENLTKEKETTKEHFEGLLEQERMQAEEREFGMKKEFTSKLNQLEQQHYQVREQIDSTISDEREKLKKKMEVEYEKRMEDLRVENETLEEEVQKLRTKFHALLSASDSTSDKEGKGSAFVRKELESRDRNLKDAKAQITNLIAKAGALTRQLEESRAEAQKQAKRVAELEQNSETKHCNLHGNHKEELEELEKSWRRSMGLNEHVETSGKLSAKEETLAALKQELEQTKAALQEQMQKRKQQTSNEEELEAKLREEVDKVKSAQAEELKKANEETVNRVKEELLEEYSAKEAQLIQETERLRQELAVLREKADTEDKELDQGGSETRKSVASLNATVEELDSRIQGLEDDNVKDLEQALLQREKDKQSLEAELEECRCELETRGQEHAEKIKELETMIEAKTKEHDLAQLHEKLEEEIEAKYTEKLAEKEKAVETLRISLEEMESDKENLEEVHREKIAELTEKLKANQETLKALNETINELKKTRETLKDDEEVQQLYEEKLAALKAEHEAAMERLREKEEELQNAGKTEEKLDDEERKRFEEELQAKEEEIQRLKAELQHQDTMSSESDGSNKESTLVGGSSGDGRDSKRSSISSGGSHGHSSSSSRGPTQATSGHLCRKAINMSIVNKWQNLVSTLTTHEKFPPPSVSADKKQRDNISASVSNLTKDPQPFKGRRPSTGNPLPPSTNDNPPAPVKIRASESSDGTTTPGSEDCSRSQTGASTSASSVSLRPPTDQAHSRVEKSPSRPGFLKPKGTVPLDKRPAWRF